MKKLGMRMPQRVNGKIGYPAGGTGTPLPGTSSQVPPAAPPASNNSSWASRAFSIARKSLMPGTQKPPAQEIPNRTALAEHLGSAESNKPFSQAVDMVNSNLATNGAPDISAAKLEQYKQLTQDVNAGKISNTTAFFESAGGWATDETSSVPDRVVGAAFNFGGAMLSGAQEADNMKKGMFFRSAPK